MNWEKLRKKLAREFARNRAKTCILGGLMLVALYMWAPLVLGFFTTKSKSDPKQEVTVPETLAALPEPTIDTPGNWQELVAAVQKDARMRPASLAAAVRDPFAVASAEPVPGETAAALNAPPMELASVEPPHQPTPQELGLQLRGTIVGAQIRTANINGMNYQEGDQVFPAGEASETPGVDADPLRFEVVEIAADYALLERQGTQYRLELPAATRKSDGRITIRILK